MAAGEVALRAERLVKIFDKTVALDEATFSVENGEVFGLLGSNGAGKTTALRIFCGLLRPTGGIAEILGFSVVDDPMRAKARIGYLPETPELYETITGEEFLNLVGTLRKMNEKKLNKRIRNIGGIMELGNQLYEQVGTYSKGMRQKIAFAAAVIHNPEILLLDEPTAGLDPRFGKLFKKWIREFANRGQTVLMCTHQTQIAEEICDRVAIINKGRILEIGSIDELKAKFKQKSLEDVFIQVIGGKEWDLLQSLS
jgi:ABC-type multidrug transport system ATPase subunit